MQDSVRDKAGYRGKLFEDVFADPRLNLQPPGVAAMALLFCRNHNWIAEKLLICAAPGAMPADTAALPWTRLRPGVRIKPNGPAFVASVTSRSRSLAPSLALSPAPSPAIG